MAEPRLEMPKLSHLGDLSSSGCSLARLGAFSTDLSPADAGAP